MGAEDVVVAEEAAAATEVAAPTTTATTAAATTTTTIMATPAAVVTTTIILAVEATVADEAATTTNAAAIATTQAATNNHSNLHPASHLRRGIRLHSSRTRHLEDVGSRRRRVCRRACRLFRGGMVEAHHRRRRVGLHLIKGSIRGSSSRDRLGCSSSSRRLDSIMVVVVAVVDMGDKDRMEEVVIGVVVIGIIRGGARGMVAEVEEEGVGVGTLIDRVLIG